MSGAWRVIDNNKANKASSSYTSRYYDLSHLRLQWLFETDNTNRSISLLYYDTIGYGTIKYSFDTIELTDKLASLGPCWLQSTPSYDTFISIIRKTKGTRPLAVLLMDQSKTSGVGNYILSEVLYMTGMYSVHIQCAVYNAL